MRRRATSLRLRLTLSYGVVFFVVGFLLLAFTYLLMRRFLINQPEEIGAHVAQDLHLSGAYLRSRMPAPGGGTQSVQSFARAVQDRTVSHLLQRLPFLTFGALGLAAIVSVGLGWLVAGRMLRPVQEMATVARRLSASTLHERIALQGPRDELRELADSFDAMLTRLEAAFQAQREFVANASHELRTPLTVMRTELDVTLADPHASAAELRAMADTLRSAIARSEDVIDKLLVLAESGELGVRGPVDLALLAQDATLRFEREAARRSLSFAARLAPGQAVVSGDEALLERLVANLVDNAVRYAAAGSVIRVEAGARDAEAWVRVANEGDVIDPLEVPRLFERFYRRDPSRSRHTGGSGLGMAIVAAVADVHQGAVAAEAPPGGGLVITVRLPLLAQPAAAQAPVV